MPSTAASSSAERYHRYDERAPRTPAAPATSPFTSVVPPAPADTSNVQLANANMNAVRSIDVGAGILSELGTQREQLVAARSALNENERTLGRGRRLISTMLLRAKYRTALKVTVICLQVTLIIVLLVAKYAPVGEAAPTPPPLPPPPFSPPAG